MNVVIPLKGILSMFYSIRIKVTRISAFRNEIKMTIDLLYRQQMDRH
jgi:hypothetical protein